MRCLKIVRVALLAILCAGLIAPSVLGQSKIEAVAGIAPVAWAVEQVGGDRVEVSVMLPTGASPETYAPAPQEMIRLSAARMLFVVGVPFEERLTERVHEFSEGIIITNVAEGLGLRHFDSENHEHEHGLADPHVWLDPLRMYSIVENITSSLTAQDPGGREYYRAHADSLLTLLHALDTEIKGVLSPYAGRSVFVYHPSFGYFTDRYKLKQIAIEREGKEASARQLTDLIAQARKDSVHTLFSQPQFPRRQAEVVAREIGASVTVVDPLSGDYLSMMRDLAMRIAQTFSHSAVSQ